MKTAEEWIRNESRIEVGAPFICATENVIEQIQLDAFKAGMAEAETILQQVHNPFDQQQNRTQNYGVKWLRDVGSKQILTARDNKTSL